MINFETIIGLIGGLGLFLYGMKLMGDGLENSAGDKLKGILEKITSNRFIGVIVGALVTAVIQSSSATTVMVVSFVNAGLMTLIQAAGVIMGANIGTTITAQMVSFKLDAIAPLVIGIASIIVITSKKKKTRDLGNVALGFGILFMGMGLMSSSMKPLAEAPWFQEIVLVIGTNRILGILAGLAMTAVIQSSSATTGILVALATTGAISMDVALPIILGCNIGTCVTALLASVGTNKTAKKAALIHLFFNIAGTLIFLPFITPLIGFVEATDGNVARQVANAHTIFNVTVTIIIFPFAGYLVKLANKILPGDDILEKEGAIYLDKRALQTPVIACGQVAKETVRMANKSKENLKLAMAGFIEKDEAAIEKVYQNEKIINTLEKEITDYLIELSQLDLPEDEIKTFASTYHVINDVERIGDHAKNIADLATEKISGKIEIGADAINELNSMYEKTLKALDHAISMYEKKDLEPKNNIEKNEEEINKLEKILRKNNIDRLNNKVCSAKSGVIFLDLISNLERIGDHANNIGKL